MTQKCKQTATPLQSTKLSDLLYFLLPNADKNCIQLELQICEMTRLSSFPRDWMETIHLCSGSRSASSLIFLCCLFLLLCLLVSVGSCHQVTSVTTSSSAQSIHLALLSYYCLGHVFLFIDVIILSLTSLNVFLPSRPGWFSVLQVFGLDLIFMFGHLFISPWIQLLI